MKIRHLLVVAAATATVADASAFEWVPAIQQPNPAFEVTQAYQLEAMRFITDVPDVVNTEVMPKWIDEDGNEITAVNCIYDPSWAPGDFTYTFNFSDFKGNGEYVLLFPEGMLLNGAGEQSDKVENPFTVEVPELAGAMFDDFEVLSVSPDFSVPQGFWSDQVVTIDTNHNDAIGYATLQIFDDTTGEGIVSSHNGRTLGDSSAVTWEVTGSYKFFEGHQYTAEFVLYNGTNDYNDDGMTPVVARQKYTFTGKVEGYKYSAETLLSVTPAPYSITISDPSQAVFTFEFSGPVEVYKAVTPLGQNGQEVYPASCLSASADKTVWTLDLSDNDYVKTVDAALTIAIYVRDLDGLQLKGYFGEEAESCFQFDWMCDLGGFPIVMVSPADGASVDSISEIVVKSESGSPMSWAWSGEIHVRNEYDEELGTLYYDESDGETNTALEEFRFTKMIDASWTLVSLDALAEGFYSLYFEPGCFNMGDQFESKKSRSLTSSFSISGEPADPQEALAYKTVYPEVGSVVESLEQIVLTYGEAVTCEDFDVYVYSADQSVAAAGICRTDYSEPDVIVVDLKEPVTEAGRYMLVIPARNIVNGDYYESDGAEGLCNPEYRLFYTIEGADQPGVDPAEQEKLTYTSVDPENGSTVEVLDVIKLTFPEEVDFDGCEVKVYDADQNLVTTAIADYDWDAFRFDVVFVKFAEPVEQPGVYEVVIPARTLCNNEYSMSDRKQGICNPEYRFSYTVGSAAPVDPQEALKYASVTPEVGSTVESLSSILLTYGEPVVCDDFEVNVYSMDQTIVATGICRTDYSEPTMIVVKLNETITEAGRYDVVIPARNIINGDYYESDGAEGLCNPEYHLVYTIEGADQPGVNPAEQEVFNYTEVSPADGSTVKELSHISLWFPELVVTTDDKAYVYKADALDSDPVVDARVDWDFMDELLITVDLATPISEAGEYVVVIPARTICDDPFFGSEGKEGICNPEIRLTYTVDPDGSGVASVVEISNCDVYDVQGRLVLRNASAADIKTLVKGIYVVGGRKIVVR